MENKEYDPRTDRFELTVEAMDSIAKTHIAKRSEASKAKELGQEAKEGMDKESGNGATPAQASSN